MIQAGARVSLFRAVSVEEFEDTCESERLRAIDSSLEGKWLAESLDAAAAWGWRLYPNGVFLVLEISADAVAAGVFHRAARLDGIGAARYAEPVDIANLEVTAVHGIG